MLCGVWISKDMYSGELENKESLVYETTTLWLDWIYYIGYFSGTILVVTAINMLTLGIRRTCIILRHIPSWFEAVLAIAILQSCAQGGPKWPFWGQKWPNMAGLPMSQSGLRGPKMIPNDQYNMYLIIWGHFGPIWTLFGHFTQNLSFCSKSLWPRSTLCFLGKKSSFVWNDQKGSKWSQNGPKWSKTCYIDHLG